MAKPSIPTLFCINAVYGQHAAVCIVSLLVNNPDLSFDIVVVGTEPLGASEDKLKRTVAAFFQLHLEGPMTLGASSGMTLPVQARFITRSIPIRGSGLRISLPPTSIACSISTATWWSVANIAELWNTDLG